MNWEDARKITRIADQMLSEEDLLIIKNRGEQAYYEEMLRRFNNGTPQSKEKDTSRDGAILFVIRNVLAEQFGVSYASIMDGIRKREIVEMRYLVFTVAREFSNSTEAGFGRLFPTFNRVTINYHALRKAKELMEIDPEYRDKYKRFRDAVESRLIKTGVI